MSAIGITMVVQDETYSVVEQIFSLEEPWRGRFLEFIGSQVKYGNGTTDRSEIYKWLRDPGLRKMIEALLRAWPS